MEGAVYQQWMAAVAELTGATVQAQHSDTVAVVEPS